MRARCLKTSPAGWGVGGPGGPLSPYYPRYLGLVRVLLGLYLGQVPDQHVEFGPDADGRRLQSRHA